MEVQKLFNKITIILLFLCIGSALQGQSINNIFEPVFVGRPPFNALNGLVKLPYGELRHYGTEGPSKKWSKHLYIFSKDNGITWENKEITDSLSFTEENMPPAVISPYSGDFIRLGNMGNRMYVLRSMDGFDGHYEKMLVENSGFGMIRQPVFLTSKKRILVSCQHSIIEEGKKKMQACVFYSDDDGYKWKVSYVPVGPFFEIVWPHKKSRWQNYAIEPTIIELKDGRIWMLLRTSMDRLYESFSTDSGITWSAPRPSRFYSTITTPTLFRLKDGRIILFCCFTTPLPEEDRTNDNTIAAEQKTGLLREDVFTNRDAIHVAISDDEGKHWKGFRELYLNPLRNEADFATSGGILESLDKSVHQSQAVELPDGNVLVALGQHQLVRAMVIFNPDWIYETARSNDFSSDLKDWSTFKYIKGIKGHCAYNREPGASLIDNPDKKGFKVLNIRHMSNPDLVCDVDGALWNFPAGQKGSLSTSVYLKPGGKGGRISLIDRWFNPTDTLAYRFAMYCLKFDGEGNTSAGPILQTGKWIKLTFEWDNLQSGSCTLKINGKACSDKIQLSFPSENGINYIQFQSVIDEDKEGFLIESVNSLIKKL